MTDDAAAVAATDSPWTFAVSGSTGLIGSTLVESLQRDGHRVRRLVRGTVPSISEDITWEPGEGVLDPAALRGVDAVVHLSGENIAQRWTTAVKRSLRESRVKSTRLLAAAIASLDERPRVMVVAGGVGIYGDRGDELLDETSQTGSGFLADLGREWEEAADPARRHGVRVVNFRSGVVLSPKGGAVKQMLPFFKAGIGGRIGSGRQWMSWISLTDEIRAIRFIAAEESLVGPLNLASPNLVTSAEFTSMLGRVIRRPTVFPIPAVALRLLYGEMAEATLLASQRAYPSKLEHAGFRFLYPELRAALEAELGS